MEHHANVVPWHMLAAERGIELRWIPLTDDFRLDLSNLDQLLDGAQLLAISAMSNVLGTINDIRPLADAAHAHDALDRSSTRASTCRTSPPTCRRGTPTSSPSPRTSCCGPSGIGALWGRAELLEAMPPFLGGGEMIRDVRVEGFTPNDVPWKFEAGTQPIVEAIGFGAAVDYLHGARHGRPCASTRCSSRVTPSTHSATTSPTRSRSTVRRDVSIRGGAVSFLFDGIHAHDISQVLDEDAVCVRAGHHCAKPLMRQLGVPATSRASFYVYNDTPTSTCSSRRWPRPRSSSPPRIATMAGLEDLYREIILDHYRSPRNRGELDVPPAHKVEGFNPLCGDEVVLYLDLDPDTELVTDIKIGGQGCSISQASTSMMSAAVKGKPRRRGAPAHPCVQGADDRSTSRSSRAKATAATWPTSSKACGSATSRRSRVS